MKKSIVETCPKSRGRTELLKYLNGVRLTQRQAIIAKCFECMGGYVDGKVDCKIADCPLYPFMPFKDKA